MGFVRNAKRPGSAERAALDTAQRQQQLAQQMSETGTPFREAVTPQLLAILRGESPSLMSAFGPIRQSLESQYGRARENILENTPLRGGQLGQSLAGLEMGRASDVFGLESSIRQNAFNQALQAGFQLPQAASNILGNAAGTFSNLGALQSQRNTAGQQGAGQFLGKLLSLGKKAPQAGSIFGPSRSSGEG